VPNEVSVVQAVRVLDRQSENDSVLTHQIAEAIGCAAGAKKGRRLCRTNLTAAAIRLPDIPELEVRPLGEMQKQSAMPPRTDQPRGQRKRSNGLTSSAHSFLLLFMDLCDFNCN